MSPLLSLANNAPIFLELSSISRFLPGFAREPPNASDVSLKSLVNVVITDFCWAVVHYPQIKQDCYTTTGWKFNVEKRAATKKKTFTVNKQREGARECWREVENFHNINENYNYQEHWMYQLSVWWVVALRQPRKLEQELGE